MEIQRRSLELIKQIGGHLGLRVDLVRDQLGDSYILKQLDESGVNIEENLRGLRNEAEMLNILSGLEVAPRLISNGDNYVLQEDLGDGQPVTDPELFRRNCVKMLACLRDVGVRHGDLTGPQAGGESNIIAVDNWPWVVDWQEAHLLTDPAPQKSPYSDSWLLMRTLADWPTATGETLDTPRVARRWQAVLRALGAHTDLTLPLLDKTFIDLGTYQGDFPALAAAEGMDATGIDLGGFRSGADSIKQGEELWRLFPFGRMLLARADIMDGPARLRSDVGMMFSTFPYLVQSHGDQAYDCLGEWMARCGVFFFETQLAGDGPGLAVHPDLDAVGEMLVTLAPDRHVRAIATIPVAGREASRTVFEVR
jgi:predicted Ser/Thr protein kinase